jgi:para-nitrobenzyl esterase
MLRRAALFAPLVTVVAAACGSSGENTGGGGQATTSSTTTTTSSSSSTQPPSVVTTDKGQVRGTDLGGVVGFLGVPYAAPPVGALRWKPPQAAAPWADVKEASAKGTFCPQVPETGTTPMSNTSEDYLTVNVWVPPHAGPAPVLVWIHGGGFVAGSGSELTYDGTALAAATGAIVVTMNYRLGPLGFLAHGALSAEDPAHPASGMYGFEDQRAALAWVKTNAAAFGGDPADITLFGESAGGIATCLHVLSPKSGGLFQRAIVESGPCALDGGTSKELEAQGDALAQKLGCTGADVLTCLRSKTPDEILTALPQKTGVIGPSGAAWLPTVDGINLPDHPRALLASGAFNKMPVLLGTNQDEGSLFFVIGLSAKDDAEYASLMEGIFPTHGAAVVAKYPSSAYASAKAAAAAAIGDGLFVCPTRRTARGLAQGGAPTYLYRFAHAPSSFLGAIGSFHSAEVPFVFQNPYLGINLDEGEKKLSDTMIGYWSRHAKAGDPNGGGAPSWPRFDLAKEENIVLDLSIGTEGGLKKDACDFWDAVGP